MVNNGTFSFSSGALNITGAGGLTFSPAGPLKDNVTLVSGQTLSVSSGTTIVSGSSLIVNGGSFTGTAIVGNTANIVLDSG